MSIRPTLLIPHTGGANSLTYSYQPVVDIEKQFGITYERITFAAELLRNGKLVAFPTETVYGLGANALDAYAVERIFEVKGRPHSSPVIVHVSNRDMVRAVVSDWPEKARVLSARFWPGPLTLVVPKMSVVPDIATAGLPTVGVRMPAHPVALALIEAAQVPVAAPSANRFTEVSPTTAQHVRQRIGDRIDYILDGGPCQVGIESTVLSLVEEVPVLLRPGGIMRQQIEDLIGTVTVVEDKVEGAHPSPGMHPRHYSPRTRLFLVRDGQVPDSGIGAYLQIDRPPVRDVCEVVLMPNDADEYAARFYRVLHTLDNRGHDWIAVEVPGAGMEWEAVLDRLRRAATSML
jgi:L-threonylcarbamoyladenylate synthase